MDYSEFLEKATGIQEGPYDYQRRLADPKRSLDGPGETGNGMQKWKVDTAADDEPGIRT